MTPYKDTRTPAQCRQQELFRALGTLKRTEITIRGLWQNMYYQSGNTKITTTKLQQAILNAAAMVLDDLYKQSQEEMKHLPSKKNLPLSKPLDNPPASVRYSNFAVRNSLTRIS